MTIRIVPTQFANIAAAITAASPGDTIQLQAGYTESGTVSVTKENLSFTGDTTNTGIHLALGSGITAITLQGTAPFAVDDNSGDNTINGNAGDNVIKVTAGTDHVDAGSGNDTLVVDYSALTHNINTLTFTTGNTDGYQSTYYDGTGNQVTFNNVEQFNVTTGSGNDTIHTGGGNDIIKTGAGDDTIFSGAGVDHVEGGTGTNTWVADMSSQSGNVAIDLTAASSTFLATGFESGIQALGTDGSNVFKTGSGNDTIVTTSLNLNDFINTGGGDDTVTVAGGTDNVDLGSGNDTLIVDYSAVGLHNVNTLSFTTGSTDGYQATYYDGTGNQVSFTNVEQFNITTGDGNDSIRTGSGNDIIKTGAGDDIINSGAGIDHVEGGGGNDTWVADMSSQSGDIAIDLTAGSSTFLGIGFESGIEALGTDFSNVFKTGSGNDTIVTTSLNLADVISTGGGNDTVTVACGTDNVDLGSGTDTLIVDYSGVGLHNVSTQGFTSGNVDGYAGLYFDGNGDQVSFANVEQFNITTAGGNDSIQTGSGNDIIKTGAGDDTIFSGTGIDHVEGGDGNDTWVADMSSQSGDIAIDLTAGSSTFLSTGFESGIEALGTDFSNVFKTGSGNDTIVTTSLNLADVISTGGGNDTVTVAGGTDNVDLGSGTDTLIVDYSGVGLHNVSTQGFTSGNVDGYAGLYFDGNGDQVSFANVEQFNITTASGNDLIRTGSGNDIIKTGAGDDIINSGAGIDHVEGGVGNDTWVADMSSQSGDVAIDLTAASSTFLGTGFESGIEALGTGGGANLFQTGSGNDTIVTTSLNLDDFISTGGGNDTVTVAGGTDNVDLGSNTDTLIVDYSALTHNVNTQGFTTGNIDGYAGLYFDNVGNQVSFTNADKFIVTTGIGNDTILTGGGDDIIKLGTGNDIAHGGAGTDRLIVDYHTATAAITVSALTGSLASGYAGTVGDGTASFTTTFDGIENFTITGGSNNDTITTGGGDDVIAGGTGMDIIHAGSGNDTLVVAAGDAVAGETYDGGAGIDTLQATGNADFTGSTISSIEALQFATSASSTVTFTPGQLGGGNLSSTLAVTGDANANHVDIVLPAAGGTVDLSGWTFSNWTPASDTVTVDGSSGTVSETITGSGQNDSLIGGSGNDSITGGGGNDAIDGGGGVDTIYYSGTFAQYTATPVSGGAIQITDSVPGRDGTDVVKNVEFAHFSDQTVAINTPPALTGIVTASSTEQTFAILSSGVAATDAQLDARNAGAGDYAGASVTLARAGGANPDDGYGFSTGGASFTVNGNALQAGGQTFATFTSSAGTLVVHFTSTGIIATTALVDDVLAHVTYADQNDNPASSISLDWHIDDGETPDFGGAESFDALQTVNITGVNDAPVNSVPVAQTVAEDTELTISGLSVSDVDAGSATITTTLSVAHGTLTVAGGVSGGLLANQVSGGGTASVTLTGSQAAINATLASVNAVHYDSVADYNGADLLTVITNDGGHSGTGGALSDSKTVGINITAVADIVADTLTTNEDHAITANLITGTNGASADNFEGTPALTAVTQGGHGAVTFLSNGSITYTPDADYFGSDSFNYTVTSPAGVTETAAVTMTVVSVNDAPHFTVGVNQTVLEDAGAQSAPDFITGISPGPANEAGQALNFLVSNDTNALFSAQPTIDAGGNLAYTLAANAHGTAVVTVQLHDNGGTANGGLDTSASQTFTITATSVNDAPVGTTGAVTTLEDTVHTFTAADFGFTDPSDTPANHLLAVEIATLPDAGALTDNGVAVTAGQFVSAADISGGLLTFAPDANANGYSSLTFRVQDDGGTANGGTDIDPSAKTLTINITSVNDAPSGADNTVTTLEDTAYVFAAADFGFSDGNDSPANNLHAVKITTLPGAGLLTDHGTAVTAGQFVAVADITGGHLLFTPTVNSNGNAYAAFTFQVQDNGGTAGGGFDLAGAANTLTVNVTAVNDAPVNTVPGLQASPSGDLVFSVAHGNAIRVTDVDSSGGNETTTVSVLHGTLTLAETVGLTVANDGTGSVTLTGILGNINSALNGLAYHGTDAPFAGDTLTIQTDDNGNSGTGGAQTATDIVAIVANSPPSAPVDSDAANDAAGVNGQITEGATQNTHVGITASSTDPEDGANVTYALTNAAGGLFQINAATGVVSVSAAGATGIDYETAPGHAYTITVQASDTQGGTSTQDFVIGVTDVAPSVPVDSNGPTGGSVSEGAANGDAVGITAASSDVNGGAITWSLADNAGGRFSIDASGVVHVADATMLNFETASSHTITVKAADASGAFNTQTFTIAVTDVAPVASGDSYGATEDNALTVAAASGVLANDFDVNGGAITAVLNAGPAHAASFGLNADGSFHYTPATDFNGADSFTYHAFDGTQAGNIVTVSLAVSEVNDAPVATPDTLPTIAEDAGVQSIAFATLTGNDAKGPATATDEAAQTLTVTGVSNAVGGTVAIVSGHVEFTPAANYNGAASFDYTVFDNGTSNGVADPKSATGHASFTITAVNDAPTATNLTQSLSLAEDAAPVHLFTAAPMVADVDSTNVTATLTLSSTAAGVLVGADSSAGGVYTVSGTLAHVNAELAAMTYDSAQDFNGTASVAVAIDDGHSGPQGSNPAGTISIAVSAVNDAPVNTLPIGFLATTNSDDALTGLSVSDVDATSMTTTLHVDHGTLAVAAMGGATVGGSGTANVTLTGTVAQVDAALAASGNVTYHSDLNFNGTDHLTMTSSDGGGTGSGGVMTDTDTAAITVGSFSAAPQAAFDFNFDANGNGHSDILLLNTNGGLSDWDSGQPSSAHTIAGSMPSAWHLAGIGDFDGNGMSDLLWQNDNGTVAIWDNGEVGHTIATGMPSSWHVAGTGDFDGNGKTDILWQNDSGAVAIWDNGAIGHTVAGPGSMPSNMHAVGTGDFDGNGKTDILWQDAGTGAVSIWNNGQPSGLSTIATSMPSSWHVAGVGDFDGNGKSDILWQNDNGAVAIWDNGQIGHTIATGVPGSWHIAGVGDFNGDHQSDILWHNDNGAVAIWDNGQIGHTVAAPGTVPSDWHLFG